MTDAEKIDWLSATNKALMESQERLAGEIKELRKLLSAARRWVGVEPMGNQGYNKVKQLEVDIDQYFLKINDEVLNERTILLSKL